MFQKSILDNGLRLITSEIPQAHSVSIVIFIGTGVCYESPLEVGISHFIEHMCFKGTRKRQTAKEISEAIEGTGGILNGATDKELTVFWCKVASHHFSLAIDILIDIIRNSRLDASDIEKERQIIIEEINMSIDSPQDRVDILIDELLWPEQPLGWDTAGKKDTVAKLTPNQIAQYFNKHYLPNNIVISIAGNINIEEIREMTNQHVKGWQPGILATRFPSNSLQEVPRFRTETRKIEQVNICFGIQGLSLLHADRFALDLLSIILGEGMSSRLFIELRENEGITYDISSCTTHFTDAGALLITAGVHPKRFNKAVESILKQVSKIKKEITEAELYKAKELAKGRLLLAMEDSRIVANWLGAQEILTGKILTIEDAIAHIDGVTIADMKRVAQQLLITDRLNLAAVGPINPREKNLKQLLKIG